MTNQVDISEETIQREWQRIALEHSAQPEQPETASAAGLNFEGVEGVEVQGEHLPAPQEAGATLDEKIAIAETVINGALVFAIDALAGIKVGDDKYQRVAHSWAVVIANRFEGGIFDFLASYKDELAAVGASMVFIKAVREGYTIKKEKGLDEKIAKADNKKTGQKAGASDDSK